MVKLRIRETEARIYPRANLMKIVGKTNANLKRLGKSLTGKSTGDPKRLRGHQPLKEEAMTKASQVKMTRSDVESVDCNTAILNFNK